MKQFFLRPLEFDDEERMLAWMKDTYVTQYLRLDGEHKTLADMRAFIKASKDDISHLHRAISDENDRYCGTISLKNIDLERKEAEYAIVLHPEAMGTGAAKYASKEILRIAFEQLGLTRVYLNVIERNVRAIRLYEKLGFRYQHTTTINLKGNPSERQRWYEMKREQFECREMTE